MTFHKITPEMTIGELVQSGAYGAFADYIFTDMTPDHWDAPLSSYGFETVGFVPALHRMEELAADGGCHVHPLYGEAERLREWDKRKPVFLDFPGPVPDRPYILILPGGGFNRQWGLIEGMAIAAACNSLGFTAFVLFYRTKQEPVVPKALEDLYACIRQIEARAAEFRVQSGRYLLGGFSAGATLAGEAGSVNLGWKTADVSKPELIFLAYPAVRMREFYQGWAAFPPGHPVHDGSAAFLRRLAGPEFTEADLVPYELTDHMDGSYPPTFLTANRDDGTVPFLNSASMAEACARLGIPYRTRFGKTGGHSFGLGLGLEVGGWLEEALDFWNELQ